MEDTELPLYSLNVYRTPLHVLGELDDVFCILSSASHPASIYSTFCCCPCIPLVKWVQRGEMGTLHFVT